MHFYHRPTTYLDLWLFFRLSLQATNLTKKNNRMAFGRGIAAALNGLISNIKFNNNMHYYYLFHNNLISYCKERRQGKALQG